MRPVRVTQTGVGVSVPIPIDQYQGPTNIGLGVVINGAATVTIEHTFDDVFDPAFNPATATWFPHPTLVNIVANTDSNYAAPPVACRINQTVGAGSSTLNLIQAGAVG